VTGRVGRSASAKALDEAAITLAVTAHIRHTETEYDTLLAQGYDRIDARQMVQDQIEDVLKTWELNQEC
jgi:hypothetical protein